MTRMPQCFGRELIHYGAGKAISRFPILNIRGHSMRQRLSSRGSKNEHRCHPSSRQAFTMLGHRKIRVARSRGLRSCPRRQPHVLCRIRIGSVHRTLPSTLPRSGITAIRNPMYARYPLRSTIDLLHTGSLSPISLRARATTSSNA